jgi:hypothetical protein
MLLIVFNLLFSAKYTTKCTENQSELHYPSKTASPTEKYTVASRFTIRGRLTIRLPEGPIVSINDKFSMGSMFMISDSPQFRPFGLSPEHVFPVFDLI